MCEKERAILSHRSGSLVAGAATQDITPSHSVFLCGYPFVPRYSTGIHDPLLSSAMYLSDGITEVVFVANDIIWISKQSVRRIRDRIAANSTVPAGNIMVSATHTHSGPIMLDYISNAEDAAVPKTDPEYVKYFEEQAVAATMQAIAHRRPAEAGLAINNVCGIGTNRHDPNGPADLEVPVLVVRSTASREPIACMLVCSMHPTVLHEDSTLVSGDFPAMSRQYLQQEMFGKSCPVLHHTGAAGNQSPRHVISSNTFAEAERLGEILGRSVATAAATITYSAELPLQCVRTYVDLPRRSFPSIAEAAAINARAKRTLEALRKSGACKQIVRTAEVDWFGAQESLSLARAASDNKLEAAYHSCLPAEIQGVQVGDWCFAGWQGEIFVEFGLAAKARAATTFIVSLANGDLQGYICTREAVEHNFYEAGNCLFRPEAGDILVERTVELFRQLAR